MTTNKLEIDLSDIPEKNVPSIIIKDAKSTNRIGSSSPIRSILKKKLPPNPKSSLLFKSYCVATMIVLWTSYTIIVKQTRISTDPEDLYLTSVVPFLSESFKLIVSLFFYFVESDFNVRNFVSGINQEIISKPKEFLKMSIIALLYGIQANLDLISISNLSPGVFQVTSQLKICTTGFFFVVILKKHLSLKKWMAIWGCFFGIVIVQSENLGQHNALLGLIFVVISCVIAGFASVWFEKMLKNGHDSSIWIKNIQLYLGTIVTTSITMCAKENKNLIIKGIFHGFNYQVWVAVILCGCGGIYISLVLKYLDSIAKAFASVFTVIGVSMLSVFVFGTTITITFAFGTLIVISSIISYNIVN